MKHYRISFEYDNTGDIECPLDWDTTLGVVTVKTSNRHALRDSDKWELDTQTIKEWVNGTDALMVALERHFKRNGYHYRYVELNGHSEWWHGYIVNENSDFLPVEALRDWLDGELYCATLHENLNPYRVDSRWNNWNDVGMLSGIYGYDPDYNPFGIDLDAVPPPPKDGFMIGTVPNISDSDIDDIIWQDFAVHHTGVSREWVDWGKVMALYTVRFTEKLATVYAL